MTENMDQLEIIQKEIDEIRGQKVMLDRDLNSDIAIQVNIRFNDRLKS